MDTNYKNYNATVPVEDIVERLDIYPANDEAYCFEDLLKVHSLNDFSNIAFVTYVNNDLVVYLGHTDFNICKNLNIKYIDVSFRYQIESELNRFLSNDYPKIDIKKKLDELYSQPYNLIWEVYRFENELTSNEKTMILEIVRNYQLNVIDKSVKRHKQMNIDTIKDTEIYFEENYVIFKLYSPTSEDRQWLYDYSDFLRQLNLFSKLFTINGIYTAFNPYFKAFAGTDL